MNEVVKKLEDWVTHTGTNVHISINNDMKCVFSSGGYPLNDGGSFKSSETTPNLKLFALPFDIFRNEKEEPVG